MSYGAGNAAGADVLVVAEQLRRRVPGGIGTYVKGLLGGLGEIAPTARPSIGVVATRATGPDPLDAYAFPQTTVHLPPRLVATLWRHGIGKVSGGHILHATSFALPPTAARVVMTVHDLAFLHHPDAYPGRGLRWHVAALHAAIEKSIAFVVPSQPVASDLARSGADPSCIHVIPEGADHLPPPDTASAAAILHQAGIDGPFLLSVGTLEPRKNLLRLLEAFSRAKSSLPEHTRLVVVGPRGWGGDVAVDTSDVVFLGAVGNAELAGLYEAATLMCFVPLEEGFGLPVVESMQSGTPVLSSAVPAAGGATILVDPFDVDSIASGIVTGVMDAARRNEAIAAGALRAHGLRWRDVATAHALLWRDLLETGAP